MKNKIKKIAIIFITIINAATAMGREYITDRIRSDDTIESIAKRNLDKVKNRYGKDFKTYGEEIKKWNPLIKNWQHPPKHQLIYVDYPFNEYVQGSSWAPVLGSDEGVTEYSRHNSLTLFYANTIGDYVDKTATQSITSTQNFPLTLGLNFTTSNEEKEHFLVGSAYWAMPREISVARPQGTESTIKIPGEVGSTLYYQYFFQSAKFGVYSGYDFEKLNSFNASEVLNGAEVHNLSHQLHYATIGVVKGFTIRDFRFNLRTSLSHMVSSSVDTGIPFKGNKGIIQFTYLPESFFTISAFYKRHQLNGATDLEINRFGLSVGFTVY